MTARHVSLALALVGAVACGCARPAPPAAIGSDPTPPASEQPRQATELPAERRPRFWVANAGLHAHDLDGQPLASLGEFGDRAIRLGDGRVVAVREHGQRVQLAVLGDDGQLGATVELPTVFDADSCQPRALRPGELEAAAEGDDWDAYPTTLALQSDRDLHLARGGAFACLTLLDRNENMADYEISVAVELATGQVTQALSLDLSERCPEAEPHPACASYESTRIWIEAPEVEARDWPLRHEAGFILDASGARRADLCPPGVRDDPEFDVDWGLCPEVELESSSTRFLMFTGNMSEGDYIHREPVIFDRASGDLWRIYRLDAEGAGFRWVAVEPAHAFDDNPEIAGYPLDVVGESQIAALPGDRFWIDGLLLIPARQEIVEIGGQLALTVTP